MFILIHINKLSYEEEWPGICISCLITFSCSSILYTHLINIIEPWTKTGSTDRCKVNIDKVVSRIPGQTSAAHLGAIILWSIRCQLFNLAGSSVSDQYSTAAMRESTHAGRSVLLSQRGPNEDNVDSFVLGWQIWSRVHGASFWPGFHPALLSKHYKNWQILRRVSQTMWEKFLKLSTAVVAGYDYDYHCQIQPHSWPNVPGWSPARPNQLLFQYLVSL